MSGRIKRERADLLLVHKGLIGNQKLAGALIMEGLVFSNGVRVSKPGHLLTTGTNFEIRVKPTYVSRGGLKLAHALNKFGLSVNDKSGLDVGASTGGFTDCLLQSGARRVYAVDVGYGQLSYKLRQDPRVVVKEHLNARHAFTLPEKVALITIDVSFISLTMIIPSVIRHIDEGHFVVALVKPQFEAKPDEVGQGGVVRHPEVHARVLGRMIVWTVNQGLRVRDLCQSPILGDAGNREFFLLIEKPLTNGGIRD
jgi:23S rRNA (cytidine1920-2'-O)/16S rRNA (cytidine1409-2'-O)-methyltransferase